MCNNRFSQLLDLAHEGDECAIAELFQVFGFRFGIDDPSSICANQRASADKKSPASAQSFISGNQCGSVVKLSPSSDLRLLTSGNAEGGAQC